MENKLIQKKSHSINIENRQKGILSGVEKVISSNENVLSLSTSEGGLTINGSALKITKFDADSGQLVFEGSVNKMVYSAASMPLIKKIFK